MVYLSLAEFGYSEYASYEYASENGALAKATALESSGTSGASFGTLARVASTATLNASGSLVNFVGTAVSSTAINTTSINLNVGWSAVNIINAELNSTNSSSTLFNSREIKEAFFNSVGLSSFSAVVIDGFSLDAAGISNASFVGNSIVSALFKSEGKSAVGFKPVGIFNTSCDISVPQSNLNIFTVSLKSSDLVSYGICTSNIRTTQYNGASLSSSSNSSSIYVTAGVMATVLNINAKSQSNIKAGALTSTTFNSLTPSESIVFMPLGGQLISTYMYASNSSSAMFKQGSPVATYLPPAYDVIYRDFENRKVMWK